MDRFGISHLAKRSIGELSGGQTQRVFLCRALISSPEILILDEPDTFVDMSFSEDLRDILRELNNNMAILLVSHNIGPLISSLTSVACVNETLHYHTSEEFSHELFESAGCPLHLVEHGEIPHTILKKHGGT
jgi:zinc transport system ATP-binding protein